MVKRFAAMLAVWFGVAAAWMVLAGTVWVRTQASDSALRGKVGKLWGNPQTQAPPTVTWRRAVIEPEESRQKDAATGAVVTVTKQVKRDLCGTAPLASSRVTADLHLNQRRKGLLWYATYAVEFEGTYAFRNGEPAPAEHTVRFPLPDRNGIYDAFAFEVDGQEAPVTVCGGEVLHSLILAPGEEARVRIAYRSFGLDRWMYKFDAASESGNVRDFSLALTTNFAEVDFPDGSLSPTVKSPRSGGWQLEWAYDNLMAGAGIGVAMPHRINPGPFAARIAYFAPVCLLFFFFVLFVLTHMRGTPLASEHHFFLGCAFFAFNLLFAYLVDHLDLHLAFFVSAAVSVFLVVSYLRWVLGPTFACREAAGAQLVYLVLFSYSHFYEGYTGLIVTIGAILTLFIVMQATARSRAFRRATA
jgi:hypothetical protein